MRQPIRNYARILCAALFASAALCAETGIAQRLVAAQKAERANDYGAASREYEAILRVQPKNALIRQSLAITYHLQNRYPEAIAEFQRALRLDSSLWGAELFLGMDFYKTNQFPLAIPPLEKSIRLNAKMAEPEARYWLASAYSALDKHEDALRELRRDLELRPKDVDVLYSLTRAYDQSAAALFERLGRIEPNSAAVSILQAERLVEEKRLSLARSQYKRALRLRPDFAGWIPALAEDNAPAAEEPDSPISSTDARANLDLADLLGRAGDLKTQSAILEDLERRKGTDAEAAKLIASAKAHLEARTAAAQSNAGGAQEIMEGLNLLRQGRYKDAEAPLARAAQANPGNYLRLALARARTEAGDSAPAEEELQKILLEEPKNVDALHLLGRNYKRQAEATLQQMIELDPDSYGVHELLGQHHEEHTEFEPAIQEYQAALAKRPDAGGVRYAIGNVYRKMGQFDQAERWLTDEIKRNPYHGLAQYRLGSVCIELGRPADAIPHLERALRSHPRLLDARLDLGRAYTAAGRYPEALSTLKQVAELEPANDRVHYLLSTVYSKQGRKEEAREELATYQRLTRQRLQQTQQDVRDATDALENSRK